MNLPYDLNVEQYSTLLIEFFEKQMIQLEQNGPVDFDLLKEQLYDISEQVNWLELPLYDQWVI